MRCAEFNVNATTPTSSIAPNNVGLFANASGYLISLASGGAITQVGSVFTGVVQPQSIPTGQKQALSGVFYGAATGPVVTGLGHPTIWLPVKFNGADFAIPAYGLVG